MELVLELLVRTEVHVGRILGALGSAPPLADVDRRTSEGRGVASRAFEVGPRHRTGRQPTAIDVRREHHVAVVRERRRHTEIGVGPQRAGLEEDEVREAAGACFTGTHRRNRVRVQVGQALQLRRGERVRLVHHLVAGDRGSRANRVAT